MDYLKAHSLNTIEDLDTAISNLNQTTAPLRRQLKQNENRMRAIAQIKDADTIYAKLKPIHDTFIKKNFKLTKDAYAAQHKEELDTFNKAVRTLMKLNGSTAVDKGETTMEFFNSAIEVLQTLVVALGAGLGVWGAVNLLEGYGGDNPSAKSQGMKQLMAGGGVAPIGITLIPLLSGLFG